MAMEPFHPVSLDRACVTDAARLYVAVKADDKKKAQPFPRPDRWSGPRH